MPYELPYTESYENYDWINKSGTVDAMKLLNKVSKQIGE